MQRLAVRAIMMPRVAPSVSKLVMPLTRKLCLSLLSLMCVVICLYLFLIGTNYYYANRAAYLLQRVRTLPLDDSSIDELRRLGSEYGFHYEEASNCAETPDVGCMNIVSTNNQWMWKPLLKSRPLLEMAEHLSLRPWYAVGDIEVENAHVNAKIYGLAFSEDEYRPKIEVATWHERKLERTVCSCYALKRHPGYAFSNASNIRSFTVSVSDLATPENRRNAFQFNLKCLIGWHKCDNFSELVPAAWADYQEDGRWSETHHPDHLVWQIGTPCPY
jgi:hypothetical protein